MSEVQSDEVRDPITLDRMVTAAAKLFRERGYAATTTRQLSSELGIQRASLYHHIRTKEDLLFEISVRSLDRIIEAANSVLATAPSDNRLGALVRVHLETALRDQDLHATMLIELNHLGADRRAEVVRKRARYEAIVQEQIVDHQRRDIIRSDLSPRHLTLALLNLLNWTIFWYRADGPDTPEHLAAAMTTIFLEGTYTTHSSISTC